MILRTAYIYPSSGRSSIGSNPYIEDFTYSLSPYFNFINKRKPSKIGILNLYFYLGKIDIVFFNWIEDLPDKKGGKFQTVLFILLILILKIMRIKIFYTLHNKESHYATNRTLKKWLRKIMMNNADYILCHSSEGLKILNEANIHEKGRYIPHPFRKNLNPTDFKEKKYDILMWGAIREYKGIDVYLKYLKSKNIIDKYRTFIVGKIFPEAYENELNKYKSDAITIENKFINDDSLNILIDQSKITLFTYQEKGLLSSGALIYSLSRGALVIGPNSGSFTDLYLEGLIDVFDNYDELVEKINFHLDNPHKYVNKLREYIVANSWNKFGLKIADWINND